MSKQGSNDAKQDSSTKRTSIAAGTPTLSKTETVFCGATAGVVSRFVIAPLDVVKIRLQMQTQRKDLPTLLRRKAELLGSAISSETALASAKRLQQQQPKYKGMFSGIAMIVREEGIRGLWKGNMAAEYLYLTYSGIQFLVYQQTKVFLNRTSEVSAQKAIAVKNAVVTTTSASTATGAVVTAPLHAVSAFTSSSAVQSFIAGANAGIVATACTYPFDLLRTRFAIQRDVKGFYRGMSPALIQVVPYMGIMFGSYDTLKHVASWFKEKANVESSYSKSTTPTAITKKGSITSVQGDKPVRTVGQFLLGLEDFLCGALSGIVSKTGVYPLDMVRKRLQIQGSEQQKITANIYSPQTLAPAAATSATSTVGATQEQLRTTVWRCMVHIARKEGYLALYKGLLPGLLKAAPASAVTFLVFSQAGAFVENLRRPTESAAS
ncbi:mitochondrial thiamine pyrophosphate transporter [Mortierella antarctica]|nr:mitochondrial thiamine pyrophosphate transporter [Mortierella antarctica]